MSVFDQARDIIKNLQIGASNLGSTISNAVPSQTFNYDYKVNAQTRPDLSQVKVTNIPNPKLTNTNPQPIQSAPPIATATPQPYQQQPQTQWQSRFQPLYDKVVAAKKLSSSAPRLLVTSENGREDPNFQNFNRDAKGKPTSVDTGLLQINTPLDSPEISKLKDPEYNINKGMEILRQRNEILGDPVLALASYNYGAGGAILNPKKSLERAKKIYANAGVPLPETPFTQNPDGFVKQNMERYQRYGLFK